MSEIDRRGVIGLGAAVATAPAVAAQTGPRQLAAFAPKPLPFDAETIPGFSERLITSHHQNNYGGAVRRLGQITQAFAQLDPASASGFQINGLKREELLAWNSMILHELYFAGFGQANAPAASLARAIEQDFGSHDRWRTEFVGMGKALGGGSGWVLLTWSARDRRLVNQWAADHTMTLAGSTPILALDMYEHAYHIDYGSNAGAYVDAYMKVIDWRAASQLHGRVSS